MITQYIEMKDFLERVAMENFNEMVGLEPCIPPEMICVQKDLLKSVEAICEIILAECLVEQEIMHFHAARMGYMGKHGEEEFLHHHIHYDADDVHLDEDFDDIEEEY